jgi:hypothetical protein
MSKSKVWSAGTISTNPLPEPATMGMLMGIGGLALVKRHR